MSLSVATSTAILWLVIISLGGMHGRGSRHSLRRGWVSIRGLWLAVFSFRLSAVLVRPGGYCLLHEGLEDYRVGSWCPCVDARGWLIVGFLFAPPAYEQEGEEGEAAENASEDGSDESRTARGRG